MLDASSIPLPPFGELECKVMRKTVVAGNWKMNGTKASVDALVAELVRLGSEQSEQAEMILCPPDVFVERVVCAVKAAPIAVAGQNASQQQEGAFTGETSPAMLKDVGCSHVVLGHSERRMLFGESDDVVAEKFHASQVAGLIPILCVGETQKERESGQTKAIVERQLSAVVARCGIESLGCAILAYEPVWAIGTGLTATPAQAQDVHSFVRGWLHDQSPQIAEKMCILYGGSVKASNAADLFGCEDIDGGLVGGASLDAKEFIGICLVAK